MLSRAVSVIILVALAGPGCKSTGGKNTTEDGKTASFENPNVARIDARCVEAFVCHQRSGTYSSDESPYFKRRDSNFNYRKASRIHSGGNVDNPIAQGRKLFIRDAKTQRGGYIMGELEGARGYEGFVLHKFLQCSKIEKTSGGRSFTEIKVQDYQACGSNVYTDDDYNEYDREDRRIRWDGEDLVYSRNRSRTIRRFPRETNPIYLDSRFDDSRYNEERFLGRDRDLGRERPTAADRENYRVSEVAVGQGTSNSCALDGILYSDASRINQSNPGRGTSIEYTGRFTISNGGRNGTLTLRFRAPGDSKFSSQLSLYMTKTRSPVYPDYGSREWSNASAYFNIKGNDGTFVFPSNLLYRSGFFDPRGQAETYGMMTSAGRNRIGNDGYTLDRLNNCF